MGKFSNLLSSLDVFSLPVALTFQGNFLIKSALGGCVSIVLVVVFVAVSTYRMLSELTSPTFVASPKTLSMIDKFDFDYKQAMVAGRLTQSSGNDPLSQS